MHALPPIDAHPSSRRTAFTLVEMIVVMTIAVLVIGLAVPAVNSALGGKAVARSINDVTGIIEHARAEAMARRTYAWVTFVNAERDGNAELRIAVAVSKSGMNAWGGNLQPLTRVIKVAGVKSVTFTDLPEAMRTYMKSAAYDLTTYGNPTYDNLYAAHTASYGGFNKDQEPKFVVGGQDFNGANFLGITPEGELMAGGDSYNLMFKTLLCVGLAPTRGLNVQANAKDAAVVTLYGSSAKLRITRP